MARRGGVGCEACAFAFCLDFSSGERRVSQRDLRGSTAGPVQLTWGCLLDCLSPTPKPHKRPCGHWLGFLCLLHAFVLAWTALGRGVASPRPCALPWESTSAKCAKAQATSSLHSPPPHPPGSPPPHKPGDASLWCHQEANDDDTNNNKLRGGGHGPPPLSRRKTVSSISSTQAPGCWLHPSLHHVHDTLLHHQHHRYRHNKTPSPPAAPREQPGGPFGRFGEALRPPRTSSPPTHPSTHATHPSPLPYPTPRSSSSTRSEATSCGPRTWRNPPSSS